MPDDDCEPLSQAAMRGDVKERIEGHERRKASCVSAAAGVPASQDPSPGDRICRQTIGHCNGGPVVTVKGLVYVLLD